MINANTGKNLGKCFKVVSQAYEEMDTLIEALSCMFYERFKDQIDPEAVWNSQPSNKVLQAKWFYDNYLLSIQLNDSTHLGFQISLIGSGMNLDGNEEPLLHLFKWDTGEDVPVIDNSGMSYPLDTVESNPVLWGDSFIVWQHGGYHLQWTFSLRLVALKNKESLEKHIIEPINKLLANPEMTQKDYENDPISSWDGLVRYNKSADGQLLSIKAPDEV
jgi:hypothetical protein